MGLPLIGDIVQCQVTGQGGPFILPIVPRPEPGPYEVCIRLKVIGLNMLDLTRLNNDNLGNGWPAVLGSDGAGVVVAVGENVTKFMVGDAVFSVFGGSLRAGSFQEVAAVPEHWVAKIPLWFSFADAVSLPVPYITASSLIHCGLKISLPHVPGVQPSGSRPDSVLVLGGGVEVGGAVIQLLRLALPAATILTTSSSMFHTRLVCFGATRVVNFHPPTLVDDILAATEQQRGVDMVIDCVGVAFFQPIIFNTLRANGPRKYTHAFPTADIPVPEDVECTAVSGAMIFRSPGIGNFMYSLTELTNQNKYKAMMPVRVVGSGFESLGPALEWFRQRGGCGEKWVVTV